MLKRTHLLSVADIERLVQQPERHEEYGSLMLCTIMEPTEIIESAKKDRNRFDPKSFLYNWESFREQSALVVLPLDIDCLLRSLFEYSEEGIAMNLWGQAIAPGLTSERLIGRIVRRLALRPSIENWWEDELYDEMEAWY